MWREFVSEIRSGYKFHAPASEAEITKLEQSLHVTLPGELRSLLLEMDGLYDSTGARLIFRAEDILKTNRDHRDEFSIRMFKTSFASLLLFGDWGNGDMFAYPISQNGTIDGPRIVEWRHESDGVWPLVDSLRDLLRKVGH